MPGLMVDGPCSTLVILSKREDAGRYPGCGVSFRLRHESVGRFKFPSDGLENIDRFIGRCGDPSWPRGETLFSLCLAQKSSLDDLRT